MQEKYKICYLSGRYSDVNKDERIITKYAFKSITGDKRYILKKDVCKFVKSHTVVNCKVRGNKIVGDCLPLNKIPKYVEISEGIDYQTGGMSEKELEGIISGMLVVDKEIASYYRIGSDKL